ncbi:hypothetical protein GUJ93_ZPchr0007g3321 [Zizania palustris]|uniref:Bromo domain-containing protein n=1 Tax=Zizania palustris TaxID=103762 RepID=A0A8J5VZ56_ZIZPA|nr:hypothetical protein GUJ93_ZPchr0007g3321 [Zizania palustris]
MVVAVVGGGVKKEEEEEVEAGCCRGGGGVGWGTWEELVLGSAVLRHGAGGDSRGVEWGAVASELRSRSPYAFSPEECEAKFAEIQARYASCNAWFDELRKQRLAKLRSDLKKSEKFIGSLQSMIKSLSNSKHDDDNSEYHTSHTESCSHNENIADINSSSKELSKDRSSAASFTEEASNSQKSQQVQQHDTDSIQVNNTSAETLLKPLVEKKRKRARYKKMIRRHIDFRILHSKIKSGAIASTKELLRDMLLFVNNVLAFYPKATLEHMAAVELRNVAFKTVQQSSSLLSKSCGVAGIPSAPLVKKNTQPAQPGSNGPRDAKKSKVSSREAASTVKQVKGSRGDSSVTNNVKTIQRGAPAKKRGVGRPPKNGQKGAAAQQDSPNIVKKRSRR